MLPTKCTSCKGSVNHGYVSIVEKKEISSYKGTGSLENEGSILTTSLMGISSLYGYTKAYQGNIVRYPTHKFTPYTKLSEDILNGLSQKKLVFFFNNLFYLVDSMQNKGEANYRISYFCKVSLQTKAPTSAII